MPTAGQMLLAGDEARVLWWYQHAGQGAQAWAYAERKLRDLHPDAQTNSINAVIRVAHEMVLVGNYYRQGRPDYAPSIRLIPDARRLEDLPAPGPGPPGGRRRSEFVHEGLIEITDPERGGIVTQTYNVTIRASDPLTRQELESQLRRQGQELFERFISYDRERLEGKYNLDMNIRIGGVYRSF